MKRLTQKQLNKLVTDIETIIDNSTDWTWDDDGEEYEVVSPSMAASNVLDFLEGKLFKRKDDGTKQ